MLHPERLWQGKAGLLGPRFTQTEVVEVSPPALAVYKPPALQGGLDVPGGGHLIDLKSFAARVT